MRLLLIGTGGFIGSILRYLLGGLVQSRVVGAFPLGTLAVNLIGCLAIGMVAHLVENRGTGDGWQAFVMVGLLGGFTTMSAFANETVTAVRSGSSSLAGWYLIATVGLAITAVYAGRAIAGWAWR